MSVRHRLLLETPLAFVDVETTGLFPGDDRVVEIAIVRLEPGDDPVLALDTLINPERAVSATEIHGITDADVQDAPTFGYIAGEMLKAIHGSVVASYNIAFDSRFLQSELRRARFDRFPPYLCMMYLRPMLGLGGRCSLADACRMYGVPSGQAHRASADALATAALWKHYSRALEALGLRTFEDLARRKPYKFTTTFDQPTLGREIDAHCRRPGRFKSRPPTTHSHAGSPPSANRQAIVGRYWDALLAVFADLEATEDEIAYLLGIRASLQLEASEIRWLHARLFAALLDQACHDKSVSVEEAKAIHRVHATLTRLGWAPGQVAF